MLFCLYYLGERSIYLLNNGKLILSQNRTGFLLKDRDSEQERHLSCPISLLLRISFPLFTFIPLSLYLTCPPSTFLIAALFLPFDPFYYLIGLNLAIQILYLSLSLSFLLTIPSLSYKPSNHLSIQSLH